MKKTISVIISFIFFMAPVMLYAHCQIPCGIYDDEARITEIEEHITTIEKSMNLIHELEKDDVLNFNQIVRWINNKEAHAEYIQKIVSDYFLAQRIALSKQENEIEDQAYTKKLVLLHKIIVYAMKCKQTTDLSHVETLRDLVEAFHDLYFMQNHAA